VVGIIIQFIYFKKEMGIKSERGERSGEGQRRRCEELRS